MTKPPMTFEYKCRRCGDVFTGPTAGEPVIHIGMVEMLDGDRMTSKGIPVSIRDLHHCNDKGYGMADLIGAKVR